MGVFCALSFNFGQKLSTMSTATSASPLPKTLQERLDLPEVLEVRATLDEYFDFVESCEYRLDYSDGKIIAMGYASISHEALVGRLIYLLTNLFGIDSDYHVLGSNVATFIPDAEAVHNGDLVVLQGKPAYHVHQTARKKIKVLTNPYLIVEVLSKSTERYDRGVKLQRYKTLPSIQHILLVEQKKPGVSLYSRTGRPGEWLNLEMRDLENGYVTLHRKKLRLLDIYQNALAD